MWKKGEKALTFSFPFRLFAEMAEREFLLLAAAAAANDNIDIIYTVYMYMI
jgi:hypothetical protein